MKLYPLVFSFRDLIAGNGFVAAVSIDGRALLSEEEDGYWMFGVQPGSVAGGGDAKAISFKQFKDSYLSVLFDMAAEAVSFEQFDAMVKLLFTQVNEPNLSEWESALAAVRANSITLEDVARVPADSRVPALLIQKMGPEVNSGVNEFDQISEAA